MDCVQKWEFRKLLRHARYVSAVSRSFYDIYACAFVSVVGERNKNKYQLKRSLQNMRKKIDLVSTYVTYVSNFCPEYRMQTILDINLCFKI